MLFIFALLFLLAACASQTPRVAYTPPPPPPDPHTQMDALEARILTLVQEERQKINPEAKVLALDSELVGVARKRSADMAAKSYMAHAAPDGTTSTTLIMDQDADFQGLLAENIAAQYYTPQMGVDVETFAKKFVRIWLDSPDHRRVLSTSIYDRTGVGASVNGDEVFVVQLFASNLGLPPPPREPPPKEPAARPTADAPPIPKARPDNGR
ncbi:MAG TPA: CAP domain-containing protein [Rhizomicrobium sp.]